MVVNIHNLIAAINPDVYCLNWDSGSNTSPRKEVKKMIAEEISKVKAKIAEKKAKAKAEGKEYEVGEDAATDVYLKAALKAKPIESDYTDIQDLRFNTNAFSLNGIKNPVEKHVLSYDSFSQTLEPIYFWILDYINTNYKGSEKLVDNFVSSAGSGHFAEISGRKTRMQEEAMKMMGSINTVLRSVLNIIYDLKEFKLRLAEYENYRKGDQKTKMAALLSLKQIWMDQVDFVKRGNSSLKAMAQQFDYVTLIDAFMAANSLDDVTKEAGKGGLDLNERVRRILQQRIPEFYKWLDESEKELTKRFEIERTYLKSQVNSLKLYARWVKPYLEAATKLEQNLKESSFASVVTNFNTAVFQLVVLGTAGYGIEGDVAQGDLPKSFLLLQQRGLLRKYTSVGVVEYTFRTAPDRSDQRGGYGFRGRVDITFTSYALNDDELKVLRNMIEKDNLGDVMSLISGATSDSIGTIQADIDELLGDKKFESSREKSSVADDNPFSAIISIFKSESAPKDKKEPVPGIKPDTAEEKVVRSQTVYDARWKCRKLYGDFKKSMDMPYLPPVFRGPL